MESGGAATNVTATQKEVEQVTYLPNKVYSSGKSLCHVQCHVVHCTFIGLCIYYELLSVSAP